MKIGNDWVIRFRRSKGIQSNACWAASLSPDPALQCSVTGPAARPQTSLPSRPAWTEILMTAGGGEPQADGRGEPRPGAGPLGDEPDDDTEPLPEDALDDAAQPEWGLGARLMLVGLIYVAIPGLLWWLVVIAFFRAFRG